MAHLKDVTCLTVLVVVYLASMVLCTQQTQLTFMPHNSLFAASSLLQGCDPFAQTQRSKLQHRRARINQQINKEMRMRAGAENLFR